MRRLLPILAVTAIVLGLVAAPAVLAAQPQPDQGRPVLMAFNADITVPTGEHDAFVLVTRGTATVAGDVETLVVLDGQAVLRGATVGSVFVAGGSLSIDGTTTVSGDVRTFDTSVTTDPNATIGGTVTTLEKDLIAATAIIAPAVLLFMLGFTLVVIVAGLALAALAARQVRTAESLITHEPGQALLFGLAGLIVVPFVAFLAMITIVGAPLGLAILFMVWPAAAFAGYLVAGIWIGDWILHRGSTGPVAGRPYSSAVVGLIVLQLIGLVPFVGPIASLFGFGAVLLMAWRTFREPTPSRPVTTPSATQPVGA